MDEDILQTESPEPLPMTNPAQGKSQDDNVKLQELESRLESVELEVKTISAEVESLPMVNEDETNTVGNTDQSQIIESMLNRDNEEPQSLTEQLASVPQEPQEFPSQVIQKPSRTATVVSNQQEQGIANTLKTLLSNMTQSFTKAVQEFRNKENELIDTDKETQAELKRSDDKTISSISKIDMSVKVKDEPKNNFHWTDALLLATPIILSAGKKIWQGIGQCLMNVIAFVGPISEAIGLPWNYHETMNYLASKFGISYSSPQTIQKQEEKKPDSSSKPENKGSESKVSQTDSGDSSQKSSSSESSPQTSTPETEKPSSSVATPSVPTSSDEKQSSQTTPSSNNNGTATPEKESKKSSAPLTTTNTSKDEDAGDVDSKTAEKETLTKQPAQEQVNTPTTINEVIKTVSEKLQPKVPKTSKPVEQEDGLLSWMGDLFGLDGILGEKVTDNQARQHGFINAEDMKRQYKLQAQKTDEKTNEQKLKDNTETIPESKNNVNARKIQDERNAHITDTHFSNESLSETNNLDLSKNNKAKNKREKQNEETKEYFIATPSAQNFPILNRDSFYKYKPMFFKTA